jgi:hypothetical protein
MSEAGAQMLEKPTKLQGDVPLSWLDGMYVSSIPTFFGLISKLAGLGRRWTLRTRNGSVRHTRARQCRRRQPFHVVRGQSYQGILALVEYPPESSRPS